jgi:hypothetical protein
MSGTGDLYRELDGERDPDPDHHDREDSAARAVETRAAEPHMRCARYFSRFSHASQFTFLKKASTYLARSVAW